MVRAKFVVSSITKNAPWQGRQTTTINLNPVYSTDPNHENKKFWDATPSGTISLSVASAEAAAEFEPGEEFYVDFTKAPKD